MRGRAAARTGVKRCFRLPGRVTPEDVSAGFAGHLMFSADASGGYGKTLTVFVPKLKAAGVSDEVLHGILVDNPRRFLAFVPKWPRKR